LLKELRDAGLETYQIMWTINDFPTYGILFGWSTNSQLACPTYMKQQKRMEVNSHGLIVTGVCCQWIIPLEEIELHLEKVELL